MTTNSIKMLNNGVMNLPIFLITFLCCSVGSPWLFSYQPNNCFWAKPQPTLYEVVYTKVISLYKNGIEALRFHLEEQLQNEENDTAFFRFFMD